ncbi:MAG: ceramidase [Bacteriovoracaceae bacterium]|nr:ceramidase [Bacteriovoracaceae bacterium]
MIYKDKKQYTIKKGCPHYEAQQKFGPPNVNWCEPTQCSLINEPANTWSNLAFIIPGIFIFLLSKTLKNKLHMTLGISIIVMGAFSFIYHATNNFATQFLDFFGMYAFTGTLISINLYRLSSTLNKYRASTYIIIYLLNIALFFVFHYWILSIQFSVILNVLVALTLEIINFIKNQDKTIKYTNLFLLVLFMAVAQTFSLLDHKRIWCEPDNIILHGHALWHFFAGIASWFSYKYYKQFK